MGLAHGADRIVLHAAGWGWQWAGEELLADRARVKQQLRAIIKRILLRGHLPDGLVEVGIERSSPGAVRVAAVLVVGDRGVPLFAHPAYPVRGLLDDELLAFLRAQNLDGVAL